MANKTRAAKKSKQIVESAHHEPRALYDSLPAAQFAISLAASLAALGVYVLTRAPSITWQHEGADSGDLVTAASTFGIPHPPGYPLFTLVAGMFAHLPFLEPAAGVSLLVALLGAVAVFILARVGVALLAPMRANPLVAVVPPLAALGFAFAPSLWSQATVPEVYTLNLALVALILWAMVSDHSLRLPVAALALGLGLAHHLTILLFVPGAWLVLRPSRRDWRVIPLVLAPLLLYLYLPLRAQAHPPVNWGYPGTLDGFIWQVTAAPYRSYLLKESPLDILARIQFAARLLFDQFTVVGVALALWGLARLVEDKGRLAAALGLSAVLMLGYSILYVSVDSYIYLLPVFAIVLLWLMYGAADLLDRLDYPMLKWAVIAILIALPLYNLVVNFGAMNVSSDREAYQFAKGIIDPAPPRAVLFADGDQALFALMYYRYVVAAGRSDAVIASQSLLQFSWYYDEMRWPMPDVHLASMPPDAGSVERTGELVKDALSAGRRVCFTESSQPLPTYQYVQVGELQCIK